MANPTSVDQALRNAPAGTQWYRPGSGNTPAMNLRKTGDGKFVFFASGQASYNANLADAKTFYNSKNLNNCNSPEWLPKSPPKAASPKKAPAKKPAAKKKAPEVPKEPPDYTNIANNIDDAEWVATAQDQANFDSYQDWRVRLALAPGANYMYKAPDPGILEPLARTNGVVFPYTPTINVIYSANYNPVDMVHVNYKTQQYTNSSVDSVTITCDFTAQDVKEAEYILAVIHFFRSMTKMFYGQDAVPRAGTPPPLCYMFGLGAYQFSAHPLAITGFNYSLPSEVDYIKTTAESPAGAPVPGEADSVPNARNESQARLGTNIARGGNLPSIGFKNPARAITTYVPTSIQLTIQCVPIMSRNQVSSQFSLEEYASGQLLYGEIRQGGGFW